MAKANAAAQAQENPGLDGNEGEVLETSMPDGWGNEEVITNFPPYWPGDVGTSFLATVVGFDDSDPDFERYILRALRPVQGAKGSKKNMTRVVIQTGQVFTCSAWAALRLKDLEGLDVYVEAKENIETNTLSGFVRAFKIVPSTAAMKELKDRSKAIQTRKQEKRVMRGEFED